MYLLQHTTSRHPTLRNGLRIHNEAAVYGSVSEVASWWCGNMTCRVGEGEGRPSRVESCCLRSPAQDDTTISEEAWRPLFKRLMAFLSLP